MNKRRIFGIRIIRIPYMNIVSDHSNNHPHIFDSNYYSKFSIKPDSNPYNRNSSDYKNWELATNHI
jgi:hypothetical protein